LAGLDTPTLRGLWSSAPYLHDGSAPTLRAVLRERNPTDLHGLTSTLSERDLADLETFLLSLDDHAP
jgi:cytochrome c peroxidase